MNKQRTLKQIILELKKAKEQCFKEIDENPFIAKKVNWIDRLFGVRYSRAEIMKLHLEEMYAIDVRYAILNAKKLKIKV